MTVRTAAVVVSYDSEQDIPECLAGLLSAQAVSAVVVVDNSLLGLLHFRLHR